MRDRWEVVTISGNDRRRKVVCRTGDGEEARKKYNRVLGNARPDTQVRLYLGRALQACGGGDPDVVKSETPLTEAEQRKLMHTVGESDP